MSLFKIAIVKIFENIKIFNIKNKVLVLLNFFIYFFIRTHYLFVKKQNWTEKLLYKKLIFFVQTKKNENINFYYELFSFLDIFEEKAIYNKFFDNNIECFVNIWANIWRNWYFISKYHPTIQKSVLIDPNPYVFNVLESFSKNFTKPDIICLEKGISNTIWHLKFYLPKNNVLAWTGSFQKENLKNNDIVEKQVEVWDFQTLANEVNLKKYSKIWLLVDVEWLEYNILESMFDWIVKEKIAWKDIYIVLEVRDLQKKDVLSLIKSFNNLFSISRLEQLTKVDYFLKLNI